MGGLFGDSPEALPAPSSATLSSCGTYRYTLTRRWGADGTPGMLFIMLNPSTADAENDDPTVRRCIGFAKKAGKGHLCIVNLFSYRAADPVALIKRAQSGEPVNGPDAKEHLQKAVESFDGPGDIIVAAWGAQARHTALKPRRDRVAAALERHYKIGLHCLGTTGEGEPKHPLYVPADTTLKPWSAYR
jgi:hypothetical protein